MANPSKEKRLPAPNSCVNCKHEETCGYSMLATVGQRDPVWSFGQCVLGDRSYGHGPFFQVKEVS